MSSTKQNVAEEAALERILRRPADARVNTPVEKRPHVVVLGAGPAGLGAAHAYGPLPIFRFVFADAASTIVFVSPKTGEMTSSDRMGRIRWFIGGMHTFDFLRTGVTDRGKRIVLIVSSFVGLVMSLFGSWILWIQFQNLRARRAGRPEVA